MKGVVVTDKERQQEPPGTTGAMRVRPDHGEDTYRGSGRLAGKRALITGGDSGIGRAVAIAFAREGADVAISYLNEHEDARETAALVEKAGRQALLIPGDLTDRDHCRDVIEQTVQQLGGLEILVNNAAFQMTHQSVEEIPDEEWRHTFDLNITAMFRLVQDALPYLHAGASIINTSSINYDQPKPTLLAYATTKGAIANFTAGLAQMLGDRGIRANAVAPGPIWTPLIPSTMPPEQVEEFGKNTPLGRPGQPKELAPVYVMLASDEASYISGALIPVTGGKPIL
jgi:NAD(P)-dependent dehydrogenase (short-subunit alcohol dehydrogenase family)